MEMKIYSIVAPFEDTNLPLYSKYAICANSLQIVNEIPDKVNAERILRVIVDIDRLKILSEMLQKIGKTKNQAPFSYDEFMQAYKLQFGYC